MKGTIGGLVVGGVGGFIIGSLLMSDGNVGSMVLGVVMALLVIVVLGTVVILLAGVLTRNMQPKKTQRQAPEYLQTPYIMLGGPSASQQLSANSYQPLAISDRKQTVEYEDF